MAANGLLRRFAPRNDQRNSLVPLAAIHADSTALSLPVADAARLAWPDLNPGIERLGVERTTVASREPGSNRNARFLGAHNSRLVDRNCGFDLRFRNCGVGFWFRTCLRVRAAAVDVHVKRTRRESRRRPQRLRRKHPFGKVNAEELIGTIVVRTRQTAPRQ